MSWPGICVLVVSAVGCTHGRAASDAPPPSIIHPVRPLLRFERTSCFGTCPAYELVLFDDGRLRYEGSSEVADPGPAEVQIGPPAMVKVRTSIARLAALSSDCCSCYDWTDSPSVNMTFSMPGGGSVKQIRHYHGCESVPDWLYDVENSIDEALETQRWVGRKIEYQPHHSAE